MSKKILITGNNSYVGSSFINWLAEKEPDTECTEISVRGSDWKKLDFSKFDIVLHLAGIAHQKEKESNRESYFKINSELAVQVANKAHESGIKHFIFMSSMSVFGLVTGCITNDTKPNPISYYGESKFLAENELSKIGFEYLTIIRPPMIYGRNCKGNYQKLSQLSKRISIFPNLSNMRSMIYIDNLSQFISMILNHKIVGTVHPQNSEFVNTSSLFTSIRNVNGKKTKFTKVFNPLLTTLNIELFKKIFGDLIYDPKLSNFELNYNLVGFEESIKRSEGKY